MLQQLFVCRLFVTPTLVPAFGENIAQHEALEWRLQDMYVTFIIVTPLCLPAAASDMVQ